MDPKLQEFLKRIMMIESSGGKNTNHPLMTSGLHKGSHAIGNYGLMPATVAEIINRQRMDGSIDPGIGSLAGMDEEGTRLALKTHPELEQNLAQYLGNRVLKKQNGNDEMAAYAWTNGSNLSPERITEDKLEASPYVEKYRDLKAKDVDNEAKKRALTLLALNDETE